MPDTNHVVRPIFQSLVAVALMVIWSCDGTNRDPNLTAYSRGDDGFPILSALAWMPDSSLLVSVLRIMGDEHVRGIDCDASGLFVLKANGNLDLVEQSSELCAVLGSGDVAVSGTGRFISFRPIYSVDGHEIHIFDRRLKSSHSVVHRCDINTTQPEWTANGDTLIVVGECAGKDSILYFDSKGKRQWGYSTDAFPGGVASVAIAHDAQLVAVQSAESSRPIIWVASTNRNLEISRVGTGAFPAWQPHSQLLAAFDQSNSVNRLVFWDMVRGSVPADSGVPLRLSVELGEHSVVPPLLWTRDGAKLVFSVGMAILEFNINSLQLDTLVVIGGTQ